MSCPSDIEVILHMHVSAYPHPRMDAPAVKDAIERFLLAGVIEHYRDSPVLFRTTPKGVKWVEMITKTPFPEQVWADPRNEYGDQR